MADAYLALIGFAAWTLALPAIYVGYRVALVLSFKKPANAWPRGQQSDDPVIIKRMQDAHMNCLENLPVFAVIVLVAGLTEQLAAINLLALGVLAMRIGQSLTHMIGTTPALVFVRANFFAVQVILFVWMILRLV